MPYYGRHDSSLQLSRQIAWNEDVKAEIWTTIIAQKILNQAFYLGSCGFWKRASPSLISIMGLDLFDPSNREGTQLGFILTPCLEMIFSREQDSGYQCCLGLRLHLDFE